MPHCSCVSNSELGQTIHEHQHHHDDFTIAEGKAHYAPDLRLEPVHIGISLTFYQDSLKKHYFDAKIVQTIVCNKPAKSISFDGINFENVLVKDLDNHELAFNYDGNLIHVTYAKDVAVNEKRSIEISYRVNMPISGVCFNYVNNSHLGDFACTDHETERARYWLACVDYPAIRTKLDFYVTAPFQVFANGTLQADSKDNLHHYQLDYRCPSYLICFAVGEFVTVDDEQVHGIPIKYIAPKNTKPEDLITSFNRTPHILNWLEKRLNVPFPFPKYFQVIFPGQGGAMENISLVTWDYSLLVDEHLAKEDKLLFDAVNLHEATHSYFGDALVIRHFEHVWTKESWAKYMESCWVRDFYGNDEGDYQQYWQATNYIGETKRYVRPIVTRTYDQSWDMFDRHTYPGGAWRIHMLRKHLGEDEFWTGVSNYVASNLQQTVETEDFKRALEKSSALNLTKYFDQWFYGRGFPILKAETKYYADKKLILLSVEQTQMDKKRQIKEFDFDLEFEVTFEDKSVKQIVISFKDGQTRVSTYIESPTAAKPLMIRVDPNLKVLHEIDFNPGEDILKYTLSNAADICNRIRAGKQLIKVGSKQSTEAVTAALKKEPFHGVRAVLSREFANVKNIFTAKALAEFLQYETDYRALMHATLACIDYRDNAIKDSLFQLLQRDGLGYITHARALQAYGSQNFTKDEADTAIDMILAHIDKDTRYSFPIVKRGGYRALGTFGKSKKAYKALLDRLPVGKERNECRAIIVASLGSIAATFKKDKKRDTIKLLVDLLLDDEHPTREAAIAALVSLRAKSALANIKATKPLFATQYYSWIERKIKSLSEGEGTEDVKKLSKDVEDLKNLVKVLQNKLEDLEKKP